MFRPAILYVDDEQANLDTFKRAFGGDFLVQTCLSAKEALEILQKEEFPLVIADQRMPGMTGIELCEKLVSAKPQTIRMILTAYTETQLLLEAINRGHVHDYIVKPWRKSELKPVLERAFQQYKERVAKIQELETRAAQAGSLQEEIRKIYNYEEIVGASSGLTEVMQVIHKAAPSDSTILICGETGTGKELLARAIHAESKRRQGPFIPVHCAAIPLSLMEGELFGHEKGAFTGADRMQRGRFELAHGGTLFLDEISEIPLEVQVKLLRVLQEKEIQRLGGTRSIPVDVRWVAASNKDLKQAVKEGTFREDLYFRLAVIEVTLPPLRERRMDIPALAEYLLKKFNAERPEIRLSLSEKAIELLTRYDWPGNIRELQNILERAAILSPGPEIEPEELNLHFQEVLQVEKVDLSRLSSPEKAGSVRSQIQQQEIKRFTEALVKANGNLSEAARMLGMARSTLFYRLKKYHLL